MNNIKKETATYLIGTVLLSILNFIISVLYSEMFIPNDFGIYSLTFATYSLISQLLIGWVSQAIIRYYNKNNKNNIFSTILIMLITLFVLLFIMFNLIIWFSNIGLLEKQMYCLFTILFLFESYLLVVNTFLRSENNSKQYSINTNLNSLLKIITLLFIYYVIGFHNVLIIVISLLISEIIQTIYLTKKFELYKYLKIKYFDKELLNVMFKYGFPLIGVSITAWVLGVSDRYIINYYYSNSEVGLYSYSYGIANSIITLLMQFIMLGAYPNIIKKWEEKGKEATQKLIKEYLNIYLLIIIPICVGIIALGKEFFYIFTNMLYHNSYINFIITAIGISILGLTQYTNKIWEVNKKTNIILCLNVVAALTNIILNIYLIPKYGYIMGSITTLISYLVYLLLSIIISKNYFMLKVDWINTFKILFVSMLFYIVLMFINNYILIINPIVFILKVLLCIIIYLLLVIKLGVIRINEIKNIFKK